MQPWVKLAVSALKDFVMGASGALLTAMMANGSAVEPNEATIIFAVLTGLVAACSGIDKNLSQPVIKT